MSKQNELSSDLRSSKLARARPFKPLPEHAESNTLECMPVLVFYHGCHAGTCPLAQHCKVPWCRP